MKKKRIIAVLAIVVLLGVAGIAWAANWGTYLGYPIARIMIDGQVKNPSNPAIIINGRTYVPLRYISESLGASVDWDQVNRTVLISSSNQNQSPATTSTTLPQASSNSISDPQEGDTLIDAKSIKLEKDGNNLRFTLEAHKPFNSYYLIKNEYGDTGSITLEMDTDNNSATGSLDGIDYTARIDYENSSLKGAIYKGLFDKIESFTVNHQDNSNVLTFSIPLSSIGSPQTFRWKVNVTEALSTPRISDYGNVFWREFDFVPDQGMVEFK